MSDIEETWGYLGQSDGWRRPTDARDDQVLLMTTCMETLVVADPNALREHFGRGLRPNSYHSPANLESRSTSDIQNKLETTPPPMPGTDGHMMVSASSIPGHSRPTCPVSAELAGYSTTD